MGKRERKILVPASQHSRLNRKVEAKKTPQPVSRQEKTLIQNFGYDENPELKFVKICRLFSLP